MKARPPVHRTNRRHRGTSSGNHLLDVKIRTSTARRRRNETLGRWVRNITLLTLLAVGTAFGVREALNKFFFQNSEYTLQRISMNLDNILTREEILQETGLREGVNIFSIDLGRVAGTLEAMPQIESVRIERHLPDQISIDVTARRPVAWIAAEGEAGDPSASEKSLLVDKNGYLMHPRHLLPEYLHLPAIFGVHSDNIQAGEPLHSKDLRLALELIDTVAKHPESLLKIRTLNISRGYCIEIVNDRNAHIIFASTDFEGQLERLQKLLAHCEESGRVLESVNLMVKRNTPVTFVVASAPPVMEPSTTPAPRTSAGKTRRN